MDALDDVSGDISDDISNIGDDDASDGNGANLLQDVQSGEKKRQRAGESVAEHCLGFDDDGGTAVVVVVMVLMVVMEVWLWTTTCGDGESIAWILIEYHLFGENLKLCNVSFQYVSQIFK